MTIPEHIVEGVYDHLCRINGEWQPIGPNDIKEVLTAALPFLPVQGAVKKLEWRKGRAETPFGPYHVIEETNDDEPFWFVMFNGKAAARCGTHDDEESAIFAAQADYEARIIAALEPAATCNESLQVEPAAPEAQLAAFLNDLSGENGELIDMMAAAIRDWGSHYDDGPWETLSEDRKAGWRGDAERALAVVKDYLTARRPSEQAVTEAMELARAVLAQSITAGHNVPGPTPEDIEKAFWALDAALKSAMEAGR
ncbi:hypothetical protein [Brucella sp.]|uniref:hypothetical protein n=1 Tax=Brucella sp. TaxID=52132 RepID=UPI0028B12CDC|nr:hypothetical protein [Brucella sp.]